MSSITSYEGALPSAYAECSNNWRSESWFYALRSGIRVKGSKTQFENRVDSTVTVPPQIGFIYLLEGTMTLELNGKRYIFTAGDQGCCIMLSLANAQRLRRVAVAGDVNDHIGLTGLEQWLHDEPLYQAELREVYKNVIRSWPMTLAMHQGCQQWKDLSCVSSGLQRDALGLNLMETTWRHYVWWRRQTHDVGRHYSRCLDLDVALEALLKEGVFDAKRLAEGVNMSLRTLQRRAKEQFGCTLKDWLSQRRMLIAQRAMIEQGVSISEAAWLAGYHHSSSFIHAFRKAFKMTPKAYLAQHKTSLTL